MKIKLIKIIVFLAIFVMLIPINTVFADVKGRVRVDDSLSIRSEPNTNANILDRLYPGDIITITNTNAGSSSSCSVWYQIRYNGSLAYTCGDFVVIQEEENPVNCTLTTDEYERMLCNKGFPNSYISKLKTLHEKYPNWEFVPIKTELDFNTVVANQSVLGKSLIWYTSPEGYRSTESVSYDYVTDKFYRHPTEINWWYASSDTIAYYLDPRNFLYDSSIFMFENLSFEPTFQNRNVIEKVLGNSFMPGLYNSYIANNTKYTISGITTDDLASLKAEDINIMPNDYVRALLKTATKQNISPIHLASRIVQEVGINGGTATNGGSFTIDAKTYSGLYNFFNVGATGDNPALRGLVWANGTSSGTATSYFRPWDSPYKAIMGGGIFLGEDYITKGQYNMYLQKFNVAPEARPYYDTYTHQYMQNISAPSTEGNKTFNAYNSISGLLNESLVFSIPVYKNMKDTSYELPNPGNPNHYLKDLKINNETIDNFNYNKLNYEVSVPMGTTSINISGTTINSKAKAEGFANVTLTSTDMTIPIVVTAENGSTMKYNVRVIKEDDPEISLETILNKIGIKYDGEFIYGINVGTNVDSLSNNVKALSNYAKAIISDKDGKIKNNTSFKTGDIVKISNSKDEKTFKVVIFGDADGDGEITKIDLLMIQKQIYKYTELNKEYYKAADIDRNSDIDKIDLLLIQKHIYGYSQINQS